VGLGAGVEEQGITLAGPLVGLEATLVGMPTIKMAAVALGLGVAFSSKVAM